MSRHVNRHALRAAAGHGAHASPPDPAGGKVTATFDGHPFTATLMPSGTGLH